MIFFFNISLKSRASWKFHRREHNYFALTRKLSIYINQNSWSIVIIWFWGTHPRIQLSRCWELVIQTKSPCSFSINSKLHSSRLPNSASVLTSELAAILLCLTEISNFNITGKYLIISNYLSSFSSINDSFTSHPISQPNPNQPKWLLYGSSDTPTSQHMI